MAAAPRSTARARRARGSLSPDEILRTTQELVHRDGLDALSMPVLARELGAGVTSIYWYFRSKDELLVALAERVTEELYAALPRIGDGAWDAELRSYFLEYRELLHRSPVYLDLFTVRPRFVLTRPRVYQMILERLDEEIGLLTRAGLPPDLAGRAFSACSHYTRGYAMLEQRAAVDPGEVDATTHDQLVDRVEHLDPAVYPVLTSLGDLDPVMRLDDTNFELGLDLVLDGLRTEVERHVPPTPTGRRRRRSSPA
jgi:AcrR family transcriptional regulator